MPQLFTNNASGTLASEITPAATNLTLQSTEGDNFPSPTGGDFFIATLEDNLGVVEVVRCTSRSGDILTITRAQEGTSAQTFAAGSRCELRLTKGTLENFFQSIGGNISGDVDFSGYELNNAIIGGNTSITGTEIYGVTYRGAQGLSGNQIEIPTDGSSTPTIGGSAIWHAGNLTLGDYAPVSHTHIASAITSGTFDDARVKESSITQHRDAVTRIPVYEYTEVTRDFDAVDINAKTRFTGATNAIWSLPSGLGEVGDVIIVSHTIGAGVSLTVKPGGGVTFFKRNGTGQVVVTTQYGQVGLHCISTDVWEVSGDYDD